MLEPFWKNFIHELAYLADMFNYINKRNTWIQGLKVIIVDATEKLEKTFLL